MSADRESYAPAEWSVVTSQNSNTAAKSTKAGVAQFVHYVTGAEVTVNAAPAGPLTVLLKDGTTIIRQYDIAAAFWSQNVLGLQFTRPQAITMGNLVSLEVSTPGGVVVSTVNLSGFSARK